MTVAVVAGGDIGGDVGVAQAHLFAVIGVAVMFEPVLVAFAAAFVAGHFEMAVLGGLDLVGGVAISADRSALIALGEQLSVHALIVNLLDLDMTFAAGLGHVGVIDRRVAVHSALDVVHAVAIVAGRGDNQAHLQQRAAVDAVHVLGGNFRILDLIFPGEARIAVAGGASLGKVELEDRRIGLLDRRHLVRPVAVPATGRAGSAEGMADAVNAGGILFSGLLVIGFGFVAADAVGRGQFAFVDEVFDADVAIHAGQFAVDRSRKHVGREDRHRDGFSVNRARVGRIGVAIEAIGVGKLLGGQGGERDVPGEEAEQSSKHQPPSPRETPSTKPQAHQRTADMASLSELRG